MKAAWQLIDGLNMSQVDSEPGGVGGLHAFHDMRELGRPYRRTVRSGLHQIVTVCWLGFKLLHHNNASKGLFSALPEL